MKLVYLTLSRNPKAVKKIQPIIDAFRVNEDHIIQKDRTENEWRFIITSSLYRSVEMAIDRVGDDARAKVYFVYTTDIENELLTAVAEKRLSMDEYAGRLSSRVRELGKDEYHAMSDSFASPGRDVFNDEWQEFKRCVYFVQHAIEVERDGS